MFHLSDDHISAYTLGLHYLTTEPGSDAALLHESLYDSAELGHQLRLAVGPIVARAAAVTGNHPDDLLCDQLELAHRFLSMPSGT